MAITRKLLTAMGIEPEKVDEIIGAHTETVDGLKFERDEAKSALSDAQRQIEQYKTDAARIPVLEEEVRKLKEAAEKSGPDPYETKYNDLKAENEKLKAEYDQFKADVDAREITAKKREAYRDLLREAGVSEKRLEAVLKVADINGIEFAKDGSVKEADKLKEAIATEWADFIEHDGKRGADVITPLTNTGGTGKTREEIMAMKDMAARQQAIMDNHELFGF